MFSPIGSEHKTERLRAGTTRQPTDYVFTTEIGRALRPAERAARTQVAAQRAGLPPVGLHTLRHSAASVMLTNGVPLKVVSEMLGHASVTITGDIYGHVSADVSRDAVEKLETALAAVATPMAVGDGGQPGPR